MEDAKNNRKKIKKPIEKKKIACIATFVVGIILLIVGAVFLIIGLNRGEAVADGEYLVAAEKWALTDCPEDNCDKVVWEFTELGKGVLTTDGGEHSYEFTWTLEDGKLSVNTDWLYELNDEYEYKLNQNDGVLTLTDSEGSEYQFAAQS